MKYTINNDFYCNGEKFEENKLSPRSYFIPYPSRATADAVSYREYRYSSPMVECLNGKWDFKFYSRPAELPKVLDTEKVEWEKIAVPGCWQFQGYDRPFYLNVRYQFPYNPPHIPTTKSVGKVFALMGNGTIGPTWQKSGNEYNFVGVYRTHFTAERDEKLVISFLGVASCLELYVNGAFVGYSEGSHNTAEFDLSSYIRQGENELLAVVRRWCNGSYLECQDMFRNNGIFRDVLLRRGGEIWDVDIKTTKTAAGYDLTVEIDAPENIECTATIEGRSQSLVGGKTTFTALDVKEWNAEEPTLYTLYIETPHECIKQAVGFKDVRIDSRSFLVNGKAIKLKGVNHHDTSPTGGYTMSMEELERDVMICKEYNINCIRTAHYPPDPYLLELCDRHGLYVVDEADLETHGTFVHRFPPSYNRISHDGFWCEHYLDRARRLYGRDKNHASIIMWSLGNESGGYKNTDAMYSWLKERTMLPIHYESVIHSRREAYDVGSEMYPKVEHVRLVAAGKARKRRLNDRPYFLCEYAHAMGVGPGAMEDYWEEIYQSEALMGGCIWEMADHAVAHPDCIFTYGGDHGEWCHDGNFCVDGIFYPDRKASTGAKIAKFVYRPIRVRHLGENDFEVFNTTGFTNGDSYLLKFEWSDGRWAEISPDIEPMEREEISLSPMGGGEKTDTRQDIVTIRCYEKATGREASAEQIILSEMRDIAIPEKGEISPLPDYLSKGEEHTSIWRAPTDNDTELSGRKIMAPFIECKEEIIESAADKVVSRISYKKGSFICQDEYSHFEGGMVVHSRIRRERGRGELPRFGKCWRLPLDYERVSYLGRNGESYMDMADHAIIEKVECSLEDMTEPNIRPQESGNRMECQYARFSNGENYVLFTALDAPFQLAVKPYSDRALLSMRHREDEKKDGCYVTVQAFQMGIGTGSCGPATREKYRFAGDKEYSFRYLIRWGKE